MPSSMAIKLILLLSVQLFSPIAAKEHVIRQFQKLSPTFQLLADHRGSPIHRQYIHANNATFWIGKPTLTSCPIVNQTACPPGKDMAFQFAGSGFDEPGQYILDASYVLKWFGPCCQFINLDRVKGTFSFLRAGEADHYPHGPWSSTLDSTGNTLGDFWYIGNGSREDFIKEPPFLGWLACPLHRRGPWQIFVHLPWLKDKDVAGGCLKNCIGFDMKTELYGLPLPDGTPRYAAYFYN